jgi:hypothetical protein
LRSFGRRATDALTVSGGNDSETAPQIPGIAQNGLGNGDEPGLVARNENCSAEPVSQPRPRERLERPGAMRKRQRAVSRKPVLFLRAHLAEGAVMAVWAKDGIVAKSGRPSGREDEDPVHPAFESFVRAIRPGERQHADESRPPRRGRRARLEFALDPGHGRAKVLRRAGPSRRVDAGSAVKRFDAKPGIVRERNEPRSLRGGARLQHSVIVEGRAGLLGLLEAERPSAEQRQVERPQQFVELAQFATVVGGDDQAARKAPMLACVSDRDAQRTTTL